MSQGRLRFIYVSGPLTLGDQAINVRTAVLFAAQLRRAHLHAYVPHLTWFAHVIDPDEYEEWMTLDLAWLERCDALVRLPGTSAGADREVAKAKELGLFVHRALPDAPELQVADFLAARVDGLTGRS